ncbi:hypothetical protein T11_3123 [Trichinella zimbabwensis]|uniref:Uncharacterized protein n=1 Tax=Trichinella zimbabwensis TaxID=268475 RepID=A0A0V1GXU5_9BILA|nr:hypothetical protein T11_3123 [Trichinella zimbabwensis]
MDSMPDVEEMTPKASNSYFFLFYFKNKHKQHLLYIFILLYPQNNYLIKHLNKERSTLLYYKSTLLQNQNHSLHKITINTMPVLAAFIFFFMAAMSEITADLSALEEAKGYIYSSDLKRGDDHFRKVLSVSEVDRSEGLSLTMEVLPTTCPVSSGMSPEEVYSDACPTTTEEYEQIECHLKLDHSNSGQIECTYYA